MDYRISTSEGVYTVDANIGGEWHDLNADGDPCSTPRALRAFIGELEDQGIGWLDDERKRLLGECDDLIVSHELELEVATCELCAGAGSCPCPACDGEGHARKPYGGGLYSAACDACDDGRVDCPDCPAELEAEVAARPSRPEGPTKHGLEYFYVISPGKGAELAECRDQDWNIFHAPQRWERGAEAQERADSFDPEPRNRLSAPNLRRVISLPRSFRVLRSHTYNELVAAVDARRAEGKE
jgi:hypothetical protein